MIKKRQDTYLNNTWNNNSISWKTFGDARQWDRRVYHRKYNVQNNKGKDTCLKITWDKKSFMPKIQRPQESHR